MVFAVLSVHAVVAADLPPVSSISSASVPDPTLTAESPTLEEGKALYENGQLIAALGKFMTVLRSDPHNSEARQYLRMIVDTMRQDPSISAGKLGNQQQLSMTPAVQEEIRRMLQLRSRLSMDLNAIPGVKINVQKNVNQVWIDGAILFGENSGGLKEQGIPILDRTAAWLKTYGQQPIIIHCYPEEFQDANSNGALFLHRYSELFNFFVEERKLSAQRFVSADLLKSNPEDGKSADVSVSTSTPRIVIETLGAQSTVIDGISSMTSGKTSSQWLENSIVPSRKIFNPEEGEWVNLDLAAISRTGLRDWTFMLIPSESKTSSPVYQISGKGNLLKRLNWDGHDQKTGNFVKAGSYVAKLVSTNSDGTIKRQEDILQVERTTRVESVALTPKPRAKASPKIKHVNKSLEEAKEFAAAPAPAAPPAPAVTAAPVPSNDAGDSVHTIWKQVIQFEANQAELMPTVKSSLERIGKTLEVYPLQKVRITGFAAAGESNANSLAASRAEKVRSILVDEYHVDAKRVLVAGGKVIPGDNASKVEMSITN